MKPDKEITIERTGSRYVLRKRTKYSPCIDCKYRVVAPASNNMSQCRHPVHSRNGLYDSPFKDVRYRKSPHLIFEAMGYLTITIHSKTVVGTDEFIYPYEYNLLQIKECKGRKE